MEATSLRVHGSVSVINPARWTLWSLPRRVVAFVVLVVAASLTTATASIVLVPVGRQDMVRLSVLVAAAAVYVEMSRGIERIRRRYAGPPYVDVHSVWTFAAALLIHPGMVAVLVALIYTHKALRLRDAPGHRHVFNGCTVALSAHTAAAVLGLGDLGRGFPTGLSVVASIGGAMLAYTLTNLLLVATVIALATPQPTPRKVMGTWADNVLEVGTLCWGALTAAALAHRAGLIVFVIPALFVMHRSVLIHQLEVESRTDTKTGLLNATYWNDLAHRELARAERQNIQLGLLMVDLDHFKNVNDTHGHLVGDNVLRAVATLLKAEVREYDLVGRFGGEEFAVLLPGLDPQETMHVAERIRHKVPALEVPSSVENPPAISDLTVSIGVAAYPGDSRDLTGLLLTADTALYAAKNTGRNRVCLGSGSDGLHR